MSRILKSATTLSLHASFGAGYELISLRGAAICVAQSELVCTDQFTELIMFSEYTWIGTEAENPSEKPLSFPVRVLKTVVPALKAATGQPVPSAVKATATAKPAPTRTSGRAPRASSKKT